MEHCTHGNPITDYCKPCALGYDLGDDRILAVKIREVYGNKRVYIQSYHKNSIKALTGRETLTESDIKALKNLGFVLRVDVQEV